MNRICDGIAVIQLDHPPVNSLGHALREKLLQQLESAQSDAAVRGIVLTGNERAFSAGADVHEFGQPAQLQEPVLPSLLACIENSNKPVVAALTGVALGGGLELALACHGRVALGSARIGMPEIHLGLIPGSGGTQRLPRLVGIETAHALTSSGQQQTARHLHRTGLFDDVVDADVVGHAVRRALALRHGGEPYPRARDRVLDHADVDTAIRDQRNRLSARQKLQPAYDALLDALAASALPFDEGLRKERECFLALIATPAAQALRYQFKAERIATKPADPPDGSLASARRVRSVAVIGAGTMGTGIAIAALDADLSVLLLDENPAALARGQERIGDHYRRRRPNATSSLGSTAAHEQRLTTTGCWTHLRDADLVIEAVFEDLAVKQAVFRQIDMNAKAGAVLATNTSYLDIDAIAGATSRPQDVLGLHFFSPANVMKLLEVVRGAHTAPDVLATGISVGVALKKKPVVASNAFGFIGNRVYNAYRRQCELMLEDGAFPEDVDNALTDFGFAMGPFAVADLSGLDIAWRMRKAQAPARDPRERYVNILDQLCEQGRFGRKTGAGYYVYTDGQKPQTTDATVRHIIERASVQRGIDRRSPTAAAIQRRALLAMVNEACLLIADGIAMRPSDVDVVLIQGYGFPRWVGGPVFWARHQDHSQLETELAELAAATGHGFVLGDLRQILSD